MNLLDKLSNWLARVSDGWMKWWKIRGLKINVFDENITTTQSKNPFYMIGGMLYILLIFQVIFGIILTFYYVPDTSPVQKVNPARVTYIHHMTLEQAMQESEELRIKVDAGEMAEDELLTADEKEKLPKEELDTLMTERKDILAMAGKTPEEIVAELGVNVSRAYESVANISANPITQWIRGIHRYGAYCFIALLMLRWLRMYFNGEFKKPGELTWIIATIVVVISTFSGVTGYLLPFDQRSYWATTVGTQMLDTVDQLPLIGPLGLGAALKFVGLGAHQVGQTTILRFNILHYFLPIMMFLAAELYFLRSRKKRPKLKWVMFLLLAIVIVGACLYLPAVNEPPPNTVKTPDHILPDWYFLFVYFYLKFLPGAVGPTITILFIVFLILIPWIDRRIERGAFNRPAFSTLAVGGLIFFLAGSIASYWIPFKDADRGIYNFWMLAFNGFIFLLAFLLEIFWRYRKNKKMKQLALETGVQKV